MKDITFHLGSNKDKKVVINDHEEDLAKRLKGRRQLNSGSTDLHKGDIKLEKFLLDAKKSGTNSLLLSSKDFVKITREADGERKKPGFVVTVAGLPMSVEKEWILIPLSVFGEMLESNMDRNL